MENKQALKFKIKFEGYGDFVSLIFCLFIFFFKRYCRRFIYFESCMILILVNLGFGDQWNSSNVNLNQVLKD